ncbi:MAG: hypothetical protein E7179_05060 [Erysipelotrichaceae bacterium]|nr:hypothetical protein [Erysipelotrichaceae bacterium]
MNKRKGLILGGVLLASAAAVCAIAVGSRGGVLGRSAFPYETRAVDLNTLDFDMRVEGSWKYTKSYSEDGMIVDVTDGTKTDWHFGIAKWGFPTPRGGAESKDYYCEFVLELNVDGKSGANKSEVVLEAGSGGNVYKNDFSANTQFTIGKTFAATKDTTDIILSLGAVTNASNENVFTAKIKKFVLKEGSVEGAIVNRVNFETASGFAKRWKAAHDGTAFCDDKANVEELIYDYSALREPERRALTGAAAPLAMDGNVFNKSDRGETDLVEGVWVNAPDADWPGAHIKVEKVCADNWRARMFINLGITLEEGKTYNLSYDMEHATSEAYDLWFTKGDWGSHYTITPETETEPKKITVGTGEGGVVWIQVQMGAHLDEITLNNIRISLDEEDVGGNPIAESVEYFAARYGIALN